MAKNNMSYNPQHAMQECIIALGKKHTILSAEETDAQWALLKEMFPFNSVGTVIWQQVAKKAVLGTDATHIKTALKKLVPEPLSTGVYIQWSDSILPIVKTDLDAALAIFDQLTQVTSEFFIFNPAQGYVIEILNARKGPCSITVGLTSYNV